MVEKLTETGHPTFRGISLLNRGFLKKKGDMHDSLDCGMFECKDFISHDSFSKSNQLSTYGAPASWCEGLGQLFMETSVAKTNNQLSQEGGITKSGFFGAAGNRVRSCLERF